MINMINMYITFIGIAFLNLFLVKAIFSFVLCHCVTEAALYNGQEWQETYYVMASIWILA